MREDGLIISLCINNNIINYDIPLRDLLINKDFKAIHVCDDLELAIFSNVSPNQDVQSQIDKRTHFIDYISRHISESLLESLPADTLNGYEVKRHV